MKSICLLVLSSIAAAQPSVTAWEVLRRGLAESNPDKRKQVVLAIASIGNAPEVADLLNTALRDKEIIVRQAAAAGIGENRIVACTPNLRAALDDVGEVAFTAAKALWDMGDRNGRQVLVDTYTGQSRKDPGMLASAKRDAMTKLRNPKMLAMIGVNEASGALLGPFSMGITAIEDALKDSGAPGRALAVSLLAQECDARSIQLMEWSFDSDKNYLVRAASAKALGKCGKADEIDRLMPYLTAGNAAVRYMSAAAIVRLSMKT